MDERQAERLVGTMEKVRKTLDRATSHLGYIAWLVGCIAIGVAGLCFYGVHC